MVQLPPDGELFQAILEFVTVGNDAIAFLSGSVKGGSCPAEASVRPITLLLTVLPNVFSHLLIMVLLRAPQDSQEGSPQQTRPSDNGRSEKKPSRLPHSLYFRTSYCVLTV